MPLDSVPLDLGSLPGIVCGPVLRRLTRTSVSVWVACVAPDPITLTVRRRGAGRPAGRVGHDDADPRRREPLDDGAHRRRSRRRDVRDRPGLRVRAECAVGGRAPDPVGRPVAAGRDAADVPRSAGERGRPDRLPHVLPEAARRRARRVGACAGGHGDPVRRGAGAAAAPAGHVGRPDLRRRGRASADAAGAARRAGPDRRRRADVFGAPPPIGGRGPGTRALGYTGATANHLWSYGEFMAMYLLAWSPVLWPAALLEFPTNPPLVPDVDPDVSEESWDARPAQRRAVQVGACRRCGGCWRTCRR